VYQAGGRQDEQDVEEIRADDISKRKVGLSAQRRDN
jgi:hypothetical protein